MNDVEITNTSEKTTIAFIPYSEEELTFSNSDADDVLRALRAVAQTSEAPDATTSVVVANADGTTYTCDRCDTGRNVFTLGYLNSDGDGVPVLYVCDTCTGHVAADLEEYMSSQSDIYLSGALG